MVRARASTSSASARAASSVADPCTATPIAARGAATLRSRRPARPIVFPRSSAPAPPSTLPGEAMLQRVRRLGARRRLRARGDRDRRLRHGHPGPALLGRPGGRHRASRPRRRRDRRLRDRLDGRHPGIVREHLARRVGWHEPVLLPRGALGEVGSSSTIGAGRAALSEPRLRRNRGPGRSTVPSRSATRGRVAWRRSTRHSGREPDMPSTASSIPSGSASTSST